MYVAMTSKYNINTSENKVKIGASYQINPDIMLKTIMNQNLLLRSQFSLKFTDKFKIDTSLSLPLNPQVGEKTFENQNYPLRMSVSY